MWGAGVQLAYAIQFALALMLAASLAWLWQSDAAFELKAAGLATASLLATPYVLDYDLVVLARQEPQREDVDGDADREVDEEDPMPVERLCENATGEEPRLRASLSPSRMRARHERGSPAKCCALA